MWSGEYDITMTNNDTGDHEPHVGVISLEFSDDRSECTVHKGVKELLAVTRETYKAYLNETEKIFVLNEGDYDSRILYWGQITTAGKCTLNFYSEDERVTVELVAHKLE
jgi:diphthamide biosynthesis methyltransferase